MKYISGFKRLSEDHSVYFPLHVFYFIRFGAEYWKLLTIKFNIS